MLAAQIDEKELGIFWKLAKASWRARLTRYYSHTRKTNPLSDIKVLVKRKCAGTLEYINSCKALLVPCLSSVTEIR